MTIDENPQTATSVNTGELILVRSSHFLIRRLAHLVTTAGTLPRAPSNTFSINTHVFLRRAGYSMDRHQNTEYHACSATATDFTGVDETFMLSTDRCQPSVPCCSCGRSGKSYRTAHKPENITMV